MENEELAVAKSSKKGFLDPIIALFWWSWRRLERTILLGIKIVFPSRFISPLGFLGMLTLVVFIILGVTGAVLMFHFEPAFGDCSQGNPQTCNIAFESVGRITNDVGWGFMMRNIHYHASNAMVLLAVMHMFYQYFSGRYKLRYEMLWITGVILGVVTVIEAYTGYDLSFNDLALRFYAFHVFIVPIIMLAIMAVHLPRNLVLDIPVSSAITGIIFIMGGLFPVEVGIKYDPGALTEITFPEWYFTSLYSFIRVRGLDPFFAGGIIPAIFIVIFLVVPIFDRGKKIAMIDRPFWIALGVAALGQIAIVTVWGFRADNPFLPLTDPNQLVIDSLLFWGSILIASALAYGSVYSYVRWRRAKIEQLRANRQPIPIRKVKPYLFSKGEVYSMLGGLLVLQAFLDLAIFRAVLSELNNFVLIEIGLVLVAFAATAHIYRVTSQAK